MSAIYKRTYFPAAPGGNIYEWTAAETKFETSMAGKYVLAITATAKNAAQNNGTDDDDLRIQLNGYDFGKYEMHAEKTSWRGFGTAASFDGATLKGGTQTIYFFVELPAGTHTLKFFADETPSLKQVEVFELAAGAKFEVEKLRHAPEVQTGERGIPWLSFVFLGVKPKVFGITATTKSAKQKQSTDGDNLKVVVNGAILPNPKAPTSDKYKNFYFSGDLNQGKSEVLTLDSASFEFLEDSVELWYDESPSVFVSVEVWDSVEGWLSNAGGSLKSTYYGAFIVAAIGLLKSGGFHYSDQFLQHAWTNQIPTPLNFGQQSGIAKLIRSDASYQKLIDLLKEELQNDRLSGQIVLGGTPETSITFDSGDLFFSLHGIKKVEFSAIKDSGDAYQINFMLFDVYDFEEMVYRLNRYRDPILIFGNNQINAAEAAGFVKNFEIRIDMSDYIKL